MVQELGYSLRLIMLRPLLVDVLNNVTVLAPNVVHYFCSDSVLSVLDHF